MGNSPAPSTLVCTMPYGGFSSWQIDVQNSILGVNVLCHYNILVDIQHNQLLYTLAQCVKRPVYPSRLQDDSQDRVWGHSVRVPSCHATVLHRSACEAHDLTHHITTTGLTAQTQQLAPEHLHTARQEFNHILGLGIIRLSLATGSLPCTWCPRRAVTVALAVTIGHHDIPKTAITSHCPDLPTIHYWSGLARSVLLLCLLWWYPHHQY